MPNWSVNANSSSPAEKPPEMLTVAPSRCVSSASATVRARIDYHRRIVLRVRKRRHARRHDGGGIGHHVERAEHARRSHIVGRVGHLAGQQFDRVSTIGGGVPGAARCVDAVGGRARCAVAANVHADVRRGDVVAARAAHADVARAECRHLHRRVVAIGDHQVVRGAAGDGDVCRGKARAGTVVDGCNVDTPLAAAGVAAVVHLEGDGSRGGRRFRDR